jgi:hypothetical protein
MGKIDPVAAAGLGETKVSLFKTIARTWRKIR